MTTYTQEQKKVRKPESSLSFLMWFTFGLSVGFLIGLPLQLGTEPTNWFIEGIWPEALGIVFTVTIIDQLYRQRERRESRRRESEISAIQREQFKADTILQLKSRVNDDAVRAAELLDKNGWLRDRSLWGADLKEANLEGANLSHAELQGVDLWQSNLTGANLFRCNLHSSHLLRANLRQARLASAILVNAHLRYSDMENAILDGADLRGAYLGRANLKGASLNNIKLDENTMLPHGFNWSPEIDLGMFTDPNHPSFWRSKEPSSPAFRRE